MSDQFAGVDFSQYLKWPVVKTPSGGTYYEVPGTAFVYDPFLSSAKGKKVLFRNPKPALDAQQQQQDAIDAQVRAQKQAASPLGQIVPVAGSVAGIVGANYAVKALSPQTAAEKLANAQADRLIGTGGAPSVPSVPPGPATLVNAPPTTTADAFIGPPTPSTPADAAPGFFAQAPGSTLAGSETLGSFLPGLGVAAGAYTGMQQLGGVKNLLSGNKLDWKQQAALALPTFGLSLISNHIPGLTHESTKEHEAKNTQALLNQAPDDPNWVNTVNAFRNQTPNPDGAYLNGKYKTWDEYKAAGLQASDLTGVHGVLKTFGPDWANLSQQQRESVTQGLIDADLFHSKKGEVEISDEAKAKEIKDQVLGNTTPNVSLVTPSGTVHKLPAQIGKDLAARINGRG